MRDMNWDDLRFVLAVARTGSLAAAGRRLGVNESTVARRIAKAEARLRARLFERTPAGLAPTEAGAAIIRGAERVELEVQAAEKAATGVDDLAAGLVRVTSVPVIVNHVLAPALPELLARHPPLRIELNADARDLSLTRREADIALRLARPRGETRAIARRVGRLDYAVYGSSSKSAGASPWITYDDSMADLPQARWIAGRLAAGEDAAAPVAVGDAETILHCVTAGLGKSLLPVAIGDRQPGLVRLEDGPAFLSRELWLLIHPDLRDLVRIRVVVEWLARTAGRL